MKHLLRNGSTLHIRTALPEDAQALRDYMLQIGGESDNMTFGEGEINLTVEGERAFIENMLSHPTSTMLVAVIDGEIAGSANLASEGRPRIRHNAGLGLSVRKAYWRQGIGRLLMQALIDFARQTGVLHTLHLTVRDGNTGAIALYESLGFIRVGRHKDFFCVRGKFWDAILMDLPL